MAWNVTLLLLHVRVCTAFATIYFHFDNHFAESPRTPAADYADDATKSHIFTAIIVLLTVLILVSSGLH